MIPVVGQRYRPGLVIADKYQLVRKLGEGGMGEVWVGHNRVLDVECAIKLLELEPTDAARELTQRLLNEARAAAKLGHAAIVRVFDFGETSFGDPFFAMELLEGEDLAQIMERERKMDPVRAVQLLLPIAHALAAAHAKGIVHRDVKPENIFLARDPVSTLQPKLVDFGVMRMIDRPRRLTVDGVVVGTPDYMSPEQARGDMPTGQTDMWSLCIVLYELIAGRRPFDGENYNALMRSIIENEALTLAELGIADQELSGIVYRGLRKNPDDRWTNMLELGEELALWLEARDIHEDIAGTSLRRAWLSTTESQRIELPANVLETLQELEQAPQSARGRAGSGGRAPSGSGQRALRSAAEASGPHAVATGSHSAHSSEPELLAIADLNTGGDPEALLRRDARRRTLTLVLVLIALVAIALFAVLAGTGIIVPGPDSQ
jgi:serine/threonine-protein kinase